jgi:hypothetical protein
MLLDRKTDWLNDRRSWPNFGPELLSQLRVAVMRSENLTAEAEDISATQRKGNRPPLEDVTNQRLVQTEKTPCVLKLQ